jgi:hypothetical protein
MNRLILAAGVCTLLAGCGPGQGKRPNISFTSDVQPILHEHCTLCHAGSIRQGGVALDSHQNLMNSRYFNRPTPLVIPGKPLESRLYLVIHSTNPGIRMPPPGTGIDPPNDHAIETIRAWIEEGALDN